MLNSAEDHPRRIEYTPEVQLSPQLDIPHVTAHLQETIRDFVSRTSGVAVNKVEIEVRNISQVTTRTR